MRRLDPAHDLRIGGDRGGEDDLGVKRVLRRGPELVVEHLVVRQPSRAAPSASPRRGSTPPRPAVLDQVVDQVVRVRVGPRAHLRPPGHSAHRRRHHRDLERAGHLGRHVRRLDGGQVVLLVDLRGRGGHQEVGLFLRRDLAGGPVPGDRRGLDGAHPADRLKDAGHPVGPAHLAVGEDPDPGRPLNRYVLRRRAVLRRPQLALGDLPGLVVGPGGEQPGLPQQAPDVLRVNICCHDFRPLCADAS